MLDMFKKSENCYLCYSEIKLGKNESLPAVCPCCCADLANPSAEVLQSNIECEHIKGTFGIDAGMLFITNTRIFWLKGEVGAEESNGLVRLLSKGGGKISVNVPLGEVDRIEDCKKMLRKGVTLYTKSGESYNFYIPNLGNPQPLKDLLTPYANG